MEGGINELAKYRFEMSAEDLEDARIMYANRRYKNALNGILLTDLNNWTPLFLT